jgi:hypothetical protein
VQRETTERTLIRYWSDPIDVCLKAPSPDLGQCRAIALTPDDQNAGSQREGETEKGNCEDEYENHRFS